MTPKRKKGPTPRRHIRLMVIPEPDPEQRTILDLQAGEGIAIQGPGGPGTVILECGGCGIPLLVDIFRGQVANVVIRCKHCRAYNDTP